MVIVIIVIRKEFIIGDHLQLWLDMGGIDCYLVRFRIKSLFEKLINSNDWFWWDGLDEHVLDAPYTCKKLEKKYLDRCVSGSCSKVRFR